MAEELKKQATQFIDGADYETLKRIVVGLSPDELRKSFLDLSPGVFTAASKEMGEKHSLLFAKKGDNPLDVLDLMPRLFIERQEKNITKGDTYQFDEKERHYIKTQEEETPDGSMTFVPGTERIISVARNLVYEQVDTKSQRFVILPETTVNKRYEILLVTQQGVVFLAGRRSKVKSSFDTSLFRITSRDNWTEVKTGMGILRVFLLEDDKILISGTENKAEIRSLGMLTLLDKVSLPPVGIQISPTDFATSPPEGERIQRYADGEFKVLQTIPSVKIVLEPNALLCSDSTFPYSHSLWKRKSRDSRYEEITTISLQGHATGLGSSLTYTSYFTGKDAQVNLQKLGRFDSKTLQVIPGKKCHVLPSTKSSRKGLVGKLKDFMETIPVELVDLIVGFM